MAGGIGGHEVQLERVNPSPSPTHSAPESEWAKVEFVLHAASGCLRETHLIRAHSLRTRPQPLVELLYYCMIVDTCIGS
ncbi:hypothetical protein H5410_061741, partial [Solanum commersonii]